jgi:pyrroline-5-carboxylate reductase
MAHDLAIVGAGVMAEAIARGIVSAKTIQANQIIAADVSEQRREYFRNQLKITAVEKSADAVKGAKTVLLCVKPYQMEQVLREIAPVVGESAVVISIAAGISSEFIAKTLGGGKGWRVIRAMPNTAMLVGLGMVAIAAGANASPDDLSKARNLFESTAKVIEVPEEQIDAVTAVSGSGPAYYFFLTEQLIAAGIELGLSPENARTLAIQTAAGAAKMMVESSDAPADHRKRVTTPNGTTHAAISHMEQKDLPQIVRDAVKAAARRSAELGK